MPVVMTELLVKMSLLLSEHWHTLHIRPICWAMVNVARNAYLDIAYQENFDYLFWLDDDNPVQTDAILKLMNAHKDIVGVCIPQRRKDQFGAHSLNMFTIKSRVGNIIEYEKFKAIPKEQLIEVDALATSCMLLNRHTIEKMYERFWGHPFEHRVEWYDSEGALVDVDSLDMSSDVSLTCNHIGWDMIFCRRAKDLGLKIYVDTTIEGYHLVEDNIISNNDFRQ